MRHLFLLFTSGIILILLNGCSSTKLQDLQDEYLNNNMEKIKHYRELGNKFYDKGYYQDAVEAYKQVNFYEEEEIYSEEYLQKLIATGEKKGADYYAQALSLMKTDKNAAFNPLNKMMHNYPPKEGIELFNIFQNDPKITAFIADKEKMLLSSIKRFNGSAQSALNLKNAMETLIKYNDQSEHIAKASKILQTQYAKLLKNAEELYANQKYIQAKENFKMLFSVYPEDEIAKVYLKLIEDKEKFDYAVELYKSRKFDQAKREFEKLSSIYKDNKTIQTYLNILENKTKKQKYTQDTHAKTDMQEIEAPQETLTKENIKDEVQNIQSEKLFDIDGVLKLAIEYYSKRNLTKAKELFEEILTYESTNKIALTYVKKINQQLNTLRSLR